MTSDADLGRIARDHTAIREDIHALRTEIERLRRDPDHTHEVGALGGRLREFADHLRRHFELEERGGFLGGSAEVALGEPRLVESLVADHRDFLDRIERVVEGVREAESGQAILSDSASDALELFLADLLEHERKERELLQGLVSLDLGAGD